MRSLSALEAPSRAWSRCAAGVATPSRACAERESRKRSSVSILKCPNEAIASDEVSCASSVLRSRLVFASKASRRWERARSSEVSVAAFAM